MANKSESEQAKSALDQNICRQTMTASFHVVTL